MGYLIIKKLKYEGKEYNFESEDLSQKKLCFVLGNNGNGKSTFINLISYGLGNDVPYFQNKKNTKKIQKKAPIKEIINDVNNYVELLLEINNIEYNIIREIGGNTIKVSGNGYDKLLPLNRNNDLTKGTKLIFSDWILDELGIGSLSIEQYGYTHHLNFDDLFRLIYFDQKTSPEEIIKKLDFNNSFADSQIMKNSIFETLICQPFKEFYETFIELKDKKSQLDKEKSACEKICNLYNISPDRVDKLLEKNEGELEVIKNKILLEKERRHSLKENRGSKDETLITLKRLQNEVAEIESEKIDLNKELEFFYSELDKSYYAESLIKKDVDHLNKILFTSKNIKMFNKKECPFCKEQISVLEGHCLCGSNKSLNFEKFVYSDKEYELMLKSKYKILKTITDSISFCKEETRFLNERLKQLDGESIELKTNSENIIESLTFNFDDSSLEKIENDLFKLKTDKQKKKIQILKLTEINKMKVHIEKLRYKVSKIKEKLEGLGEEKDKILSQNYKKFAKIYQNYIEEYDKALEQEIPKVFFDKNYTPHLEYYKEDSDDYIRRFFYYLSLLKLSLEKKIAFPRFLLIDGLDKGIDENKLTLCYKELVKLLEQYPEEKFQIIVSNRYESFGKEFSSFVVEKLNNTDKLLKLKKESI